MVYLRVRLFVSVSLACLCLMFSSGVLLLLSMYCWFPLYTALILYVFGVYVYGIVYVMLAFPPVTVA